MAATITGSTTSRSKPCSSGLSGHQAHDLRAREHAGLDCVNTDVFDHGVNLGLDDIQRYVLHRRDSERVLSGYCRDRGHAVSAERRKSLQVRLNAGAAA